MSTRIELAFLAQGYGPPGGLSWDDVEQMRARWDVAPIRVPVARAPRLHRLGRAACRWRAAQPFLTYRFARGTGEKGP